MMQDTRDDLKGLDPSQAPPDGEAEGAKADPEAPADAGEAPAVSEPIDYKDRWLRAEADLQNFRRRARRDAEDARRVAEESALLDLVALLDDLERALESAGTAGADKAWVEGVRLVLQKGKDHLARQGVEPVDPLGQPFDPALHEAILEADAPEGVKPGDVMQVIHKGYRRGVRPLRAARVIVARG